MKIIKVPGPNKRHKVLLYALSTCMWCMKTKGFLKNNGIEYEYVDVDLNSKEDKEEIRKQIHRLGGRFSFPAIIIDEEYLITGYDEDRIRRALEK
ncbi:MAG: glutaredoxin family protein [Promethearchaeota archaeon]